MDLGVKDVGTENVMSQDPVLISPQPWNMDQTYSSNPENDSHVK